MADDLDELLRRSQPELAERSRNLSFALDDLVSAQPLTVKRRWRPMLAGSFIVFALAGGASIAAATPGVLAWFGWTDNATSHSRGEEICHEGFRVVSASKQDSESDSIHAAREYLATLDINAVDISEQLAEQIQDGGGPRNPESVARSMAIYELTVEHVASLGLPTEDLSIESGGLCDGGER